MAEEAARQKLYGYRENSNLVLQADRKARRAAASQPTGEVESLRGRVSLPRMGDRVAATAAEDNVTGTKRAPVDLVERLEKRSKKQKKKARTKALDQTIMAGGKTILEIDNLTGYQPTHAGSRVAYEAILSMVGSRLYLGAQPADILRDAAEEVLSILKNDRLRDPDRQADISKILLSMSGRSGKLMTSEEYSKFVNLGKRIDDFSGSNDVSDEKAMDEEMGVAVVFDDSDQEEGGDDDESVNVDEVVDVDDSSKSGDDMSVHNRELPGVGDEIGEETSTGVNVHDIDAHWLQRQLSKYIDDADASVQTANQIFSILEISDARECENKLLSLLGFDLFEFIKTLLDNRLKLYMCIKLKRAQSDEERRRIEAEMLVDNEGSMILKELYSNSSAENWTKDRMSQMANKAKREAKELLTNKSARSNDNFVEEEDAAPDTDVEISTDNAIELDLDSLAFREGSHLMSNKKVVLPDNSWRAMKKGYEEVHVPAVRSLPSSDEKLIPVSGLPQWTHPAFEGMNKLNRIQSKMCDTALYSSENILLCAPTGAGKTNVAMLTMLNILGQHRKVDGSLDLSSFKIVYVAPMKALVQEVVKNFGKRLSSYGVSVRELSGDSSLTRYQISQTQVLVTTPEKWDVITRKGDDRAFTQLVRLIIMDEIHLLHDDRGPVLENIVSRTIRQVEATQEPVRLVGLSATLPNYKDVATFLRVDPKKGLFFFDHSYRPVPLQSQYIGVTERNAFKRFQLQNEICYEKCLLQRRNSNQVLIFVHSRAECGKTAKALRDLALERDNLVDFVREGGATHEILKEELETVKNQDLKDVLAYGFAIHHAGMVRSDRELVEDLFSDKHIAVLISTATLAWGVNLPAHTVIIKGTQVYNPSKGTWVELSPLDVLQMLGRAGRPQYDSEGEGIIITAHSELQFYMSLTNLQLPVESQLISCLPDHLNAEIVLGNVQSISEAVDWLSYSFLYVRMLRNPGLYGISDKGYKADQLLKQRRLDLIHSAACLLEKSQLIRYDRRSGSLQPTPLGRVSSYFYISHDSMANYNRHLRPIMTDIELLRLFSTSGEFKQIHVRQDEKMELDKLAARVPIPVKESTDEPSAKVNVLLQAYISRLKLDGFVLAADMAFIQQSASRIMRALFEISLKRGWSQLTKLTLAFSNMVTSRVWRSQSPLRQFKGVPEIVARKLERKSDIEWSRYADLHPQDLGELVGVPKMGRTLHRLVHQFPKLELAAHVQPITRSMLRVELILTPDFQFDVKVHDFALLFHVFVEDANSEITLHHETFMLRNVDADEEHTLLFSVPILDPLPPQYFIRVVSDRWLHSCASLPISFRNLILPAKFPPPTELLDLQPLPLSALGNKALVSLYQNSFREFNPVQTQTFHELFKSDKNCLVCAPTGSGKSVCGEFAVLRMFSNDSKGKCVYVAPSEDISQHRYEEWSKRFSSLGVSLSKLSGESASDLKELADSQITICTVSQWDMLSRRWKQRRAVQAVTLLIIDELHMLGGNEGPTLEVVISRMRYISSQLERNIRIIGLGASIANAREVGEWMGVSTKNLFNFSPKVRPVPLEMYMQSFEGNSFSGRLLAMGKPAYNAIMRHSMNKPVIVYVPSRRQAQLTAIDLMTHSEAKGKPQDDNRGRNFLRNDIDITEIQDTANKLREPTLQQVISAGIGFMHEGMLRSDQNQVLDLYKKGIVRVMVVPFDLCWKLNVTTHVVVIMGTEYYDGREKRHLDYSIADMLQMIGKASRPQVDSSSKCVLLCHAPKKERLKKLLYEALPIESHLDHYLHDHLNSEIVTKTVCSMQDAVDYITWTFLYRRLLKNPNYYNIQGTSNSHLSEHISDMVETVINDLVESKCCEMNEEGDITPLNLGMIAAYYYIQYTTIELIASSVAAKTKIRGLIEILSASSEFSSLPIRQGEERAMKILSNGLTYPLPQSTLYNDPNTKALVLLQAHFGRISISSDFRFDQRKVVGESVKIIQAIVDVISSNGWLKPALAAMELSQMVVQGLWNKDNVLMQIPHFTKDIVDRCTAHNGEEPVESVFDILSLDDDVRNTLLRLSDEDMADVAVFCNNYPSIDVAFDVVDSDDITAGDPVQMIVKLEREVDEEDIEGGNLGSVSAPLYPGEKKENWWVVVGDTKTNTLMSIKRIALSHKQTVKLEFIAPEDAGEYELTLYCMSDSYLGCDQEYHIPINVAVGESEDEDSDEDS